MANEDNWWWLVVIMDDGPVHVHELGYDATGAAAIIDELPLDEHGFPSDWAADMAPGSTGLVHRGLIRPKAYDGNGKLLPARAARDDVTVHLLERSP